LRERDRRIGPVLGGFSGVSVSCGEVALVQFHVGHAVQQPQSCASPLQLSVTFPVLECWRSHRSPTRAAPDRLAVARARQILWMRPYEPRVATPVEAHKEWPDRAYEQYYNGARQPGLELGRHCRRHAARNYSRRGC